MFKQDAVVFLVNAYCVLDRVGSSSTVDIIKVQVVDASFAVAAQGQ